MDINDLVPWNWGKNREPAVRGTSSVEELHRQMDRLFDGFLSGRIFDSPALFSEGGSFSPKVDVRENERRFDVSVELPGLTEKEVELSLEKDALVISGEKQEERTDDKDGRHYIERSFGSFRRVIPLSSEIDTDKVDASFKNGVLHVALPKKESEQSKRRKISIKKGE